jgi:hypothetical protein
MEDAQTYHLPGKPRIKKHPPESSAGLPMMPEA